MAMPISLPSKQIIVGALAILFAGIGVLANAADSAVVIASHEVRDFAEWKKNFDAGKDRRKQAGMTERYVLRDAEKPNAVIVVLEARDVETAKKFVADTRERVNKASATGTADIKIGTTSTSGK
jgi:hypothetical protein